MNYEEALRYIHGISWTFCKPGLERTMELCEKLGHPEKNLKFIHVGGTNGKGSFSSMLDSVLRSAGYKVGLYTSPYVLRFNERMKFMGKEISDELLAEITEYVRPYADGMEEKPTEFELITAIAFEFFKRVGAEIVVLEVGMGGRLDSTNIIPPPLLSVITGIALDHTAFLGDTVEKIAAEKAGIIKYPSPIIYGGEDNSAREVIRAKAKEVGVLYYDVDYSELEVRNADLSGTDFDYKNHTGMHVSLLGSYQPRNASLVISAVDVLRSEGLNIPEISLKTGLCEAVWPARFEIIKRKPLIIFDGAHNPQGVSAAVSSIRTYFGEGKVIALTGVLSDKDYEFICKEIASVSREAFTVTPNNPRALQNTEYAKIFEKHGVSATPCENIANAIMLATRRAEEEDAPIVCLGSLYTYVEVIEALGKR